MAIIDNVLHYTLCALKKRAYFADRRLTWKDHVLTKRKQLDLKSREIKWLIGRHSPLSLEKQDPHLQNSPQTGVDVWY